VAIKSIELAAGVIPAVERLVESPAVSEETEPNGDARLTPLKAAQIAYESSVLAFNSRVTEEELPVDQILPQTAHLIDSDPSSSARRVHDSGPGPTVKSSRALTANIKTSPFCVPAGMEKL